RHLFVLLHQTVRRRAELLLQSNRTRALSPRLPGAHGPLAQRPAGLPFSGGPIRRGGGGHRRPDPAHPRFSRLAVGRGLLALPRNETARAHGERQSGAAVALFDIRGALAQARGAIGSVARGARRFGPFRLAPAFLIESGASGLRFRQKLLYDNDFRQWREGGVSSPAHSSRELLALGYRVLAASCRTARIRR